MKWLFKAFGFVRGPGAFEAVWHLLTNSSRLTDQEKAAAAQVLGPRSIRYDAVRIAEGRLLRLIFKINGSVAFATFHTINLPSQGNHSRGHLDLLIHELVHVYQFEVAGSIYIWQSLRHRSYDYGGWGQLVMDRENGKRLSDYKQEPQGQMVQDYYNNVIKPGLPPQDPIRLAYEPFIADLRAGLL